MSGNCTGDATGILDKAEDNSNCNQEKHGVNDVEKAHGLGLLAFWHFSLQAILESDEQETEQKNEELLEANLQ
jgi:hypothetical protein